MARRKPVKRADTPETKLDIPPALDEECAEDVIPNPETPQEKQCRALLQGTPADRKIAETIYDAEMVRRIKQEIEDENKNQK